MVVIAARPTRAPDAMVRAAIASARSNVSQDHAGGAIRASSTTTECCDASRRHAGRRPTAGYVAARAMHARAARRLGAGRDRIEDAVDRRRHPLRVRRRPGRGRTADSRAAIQRFGAAVRGGGLDAAPADLERPARPARIFAESSDGRRAGPRTPHQRRSRTADGRDGRGKPGEQRVDLVRPDDRGRRLGIGVCSLVAQFGNCRGPACRRRIFPPPTSARRAPRIDGDDRLGLALQVIVALSRAQDDHRPARLPRRPARGHADASFADVARFVFGSSVTGRRGSG